jgi:hypothetical protein
MRITKVCCVLLLASVVIFNTVESFAVPGYVRVGIDSGKKNDHYGTIFDVSVGRFFTPFFGLGVNVNVAPGFPGYLYDEKNPDNENRFLEYATISPEIHFLAFQSSPVNLSFAVNGGIGGIGASKKSADDKEANTNKINDAIFAVNGKATLNFVFWNRMGFYIGANYRKVFRSQNPEYTNKKLSGFEASVGFTGLFSDMSQYQ